MARAKLRIPGKRYRVKEKVVHREGYTRKDGTYVPPATYKVEDRGRPGRTPKSKKWYKPTTTMNWSKDMPVAERRTDRETKREAEKDAKYFFDLHKKK